MISKKIKLGATVALSSIAALSVTSGIVLTSVNSKTTSVDAAPTKKAKTLFSNEANATYHTLTFKQSTGHTDIPLLGKTVVKVKDGYPFGTVVTPRIDSQQWALDGWSTEPDGDESGRISKTTPVDGSFDEIYPILVPTTGTISVTGDTTEFDGFNQEHSYVATVDTAERAQQVTWIAVDPVTGDESDAVILGTPTVSGLTSTVEATPATTIEAVNVRIVARIGTSESSPSASVDVAIYPPYYRSETLPCEDQNVNVGNLFWDYEESSTEPVVGAWYGINPTTACTDVATTAVEMYSFDLDEEGADEGGEITDRARTADWSETTLLFPGCSVVLIPDFCFANMANSFNPNFGQGVYSVGSEGAIEYLPKEITSVGSNFFANCGGFNQNINDYFNVDGNLAIGDNFLSGCSGFNNGTAIGTTSTFVMPQATYIGNAFMDDCVNFQPNIVSIQPKTWYIGQFFLNGCDHVTSVAITENSEDILQFVGAYFLADCTNLATINFNTSNVQYMEDLYASWSDKGSFTWHYSGSEPTAEITVTGASASIIREFYPSFNQYDSELDFGYCRHIKQPV